MKQFTKTSAIAAALVAAFAMPTMAQTAMKMAPAAPWR